MRTGLGFIAIAGFVAVSGTALAKDAIRLDGPVEGGGSAVVKVSNGKWEDGTPFRRYRMKFTNLTVECGGISEVAKFPVTGGGAINADYFPPPPGLEGEIEDDGEGRTPDYATELKSRFISARNARGWVRVWGTEVALVGGGHAECDSGRLSWSARR
jgi:hypothetical protein